MKYIEALFWLATLLVVYSYIGYGILLYLLVIFKRFFKQKQTLSADYFPTVTVLVAAYNEETIIGDKINNTLDLDYPKDKIRIVVVTDGSDDNTCRIVGGYPSIIHLHQAKRAGKIAAVERAMSIIDSEIVIFTDANTHLNKQAAQRLTAHFQDSRVGAVAGEKRISIEREEEASGAGEGLYWKYESKLKAWDSELHSVVGAAGELYALRRNLYEPVPPDTLIEDFYITLTIAQRGFRVVYEPGAYAIEPPSASVKEELKRKIRIAAGGIQAIVRLKSLLNPVKYGWLSFQYISHRVLRWTVAPAALPVIFILNVFLLYHRLLLYQGLFFGQVVFYLAAAAGYLFETKKIRLKAFFVPYYFCMMNYAVYRGFVRYLKGAQSVLWEKAARRE